MLNVYKDGKIYTFFFFFFSLFLWRIAFSRKRTNDAKRVVCQLKNKKIKFALFRYSRERVRHNQDAHTKTVYMSVHFAR